MTTASRFTKFLGNIQLKQSQKEDAQTKYEGVCGTLHSHYYNTKYTGQSRYLVGSYGKKTAIRPPSDIDIFFKLSQKEYDQYDNYLSNGQSQLLQDIKNKLFKTYPTSKIKGDGQVVSIFFTSYHVELIPVFKIAGDKYLIPDTHNGGSWKKVDPVKEKNTLSTSNQTYKGNTIKLVKMMKAWKKNCTVELKSFIIEIIAIEFMKTWPHNLNGAGYHDYMTRDFLKYLIQRAGYQYTYPNTGEIILLGEAWKSKAQTAYNRAIKGCKYEAENKEREATLEWKKIFGIYFEY